MSSSSAKALCIERVTSYFAYYHGWPTHLALAKDAPHGEYKLPPNDIGSRFPPAFGVRV